jgi:hypothetical protein
MDAAGHPVNISAWTVDISRHGARVKGVKDWSTPGETIGVRHGTEKARFRIVWVGADGTPHQGQIGLLCVEAGKYIWGISAPEMASAAASQPGNTTGQFHFSSQLRVPIGLANASGANNRRQAARYRANGGAKIQEIGARSGQWSTMHDLSLGGCYVETTAPLPSGSRVDMTIHINDIQITARGSVTVSHRLVGMGVKFDELSSLNRNRLEQVMAMLAETSVEA